MIAGAIDKIQTLVMHAAARKIEIEGRPYFVNGKDLQPIYEPEEKTLFFQGLESMVDFVKSTGYGGILVVDGTQSVWFWSDVFGPFKQRDLYARATGGFEPFKFSKYIPIEEFIIALMTQFVETPELKDLMRQVSNLEYVASKTYEDSGADQTVIAKTGPVQKGKVKIKNPMPLKPYRTFMEIEQPESQFVIRLKGGENEPMHAGLWDAGDMWRMEAMRGIKEYLNAELPRETWSNVQIV